MASASQRLRSDAPVDRWSNETSVAAEVYPVDLDRQSDRLPNRRPPARGKRAPRRFVRLLITFCVGVAATLAWQSYGDAARETIADAYPQFAWLAPQAASLAQAAPDAAAPAAPAAPSPDPRELKAMSVDLAAVRQSVDQLAAQLAAGNQQIAGDIASLQASQQAILRKISAPAPRPAARGAIPLAPSLSSAAPPAR